MPSVSCKCSSTLNCILQCDQVANLSVSAPLLRDFMSHSVWLFTQPLFVSFNNLHSELLLVLHGGLKAAYSGFASVSPFAAEHSTKH